MKKINKVKKNTEILNNYLGLMNNLNPNTKLELIERLSKSIKKDISIRKNSFERSYGAWESKKTSDEIIEEIRSSRNFNREIEQF